jgi:VIT1/CCC1 family predicted Fe2+/Mn2+ transporter
VPVIAALIANGSNSATFIIASSLVVLAGSGAVGAFIGGGNKLKAALRVFVGGGLAMAATALIGHLVGKSL